MVNTGPSLVKNEHSLYRGGMPRVTEQYRAQRRAEIIAAAAKLFAANGFHATSMADIIDEAGLSAGAFYRYFSSKEELIGAVAEKFLDTTDETFEMMLADGAVPSPEDAVATIVRASTTWMGHDVVPGVDMTRIGVQVWAEALRSPELAARTNDVYRRLRGHFAEVARRWQAAGHLSSDAVPEQVGAVLLGLVQGSVLYRLLSTDTGSDTGSYLAGVRALFTAPRT
jgi:AcrR family transcriptional regulator